MISRLLSLTGDSRNGRKSINAVKIFTYLILVFIVANLPFVHSCLLISKMINRLMLVCS